MKVAAAIIAKNEEKNLPRLLDSLKGKFDEIVLVDTGSEDRTVDIAKSYGCKVVVHNWNGFADARNRAIEEVSKDIDWIWHFDADFELEDEEYRKALVCLKQLPPNIKAVVIGVRNFAASGDIKSISSHIFIHRNDPSIRWIGKVHETPNVKEVVGIPVFVNHYGYADMNVQLDKARRNYQLLKEELSNIERGTRTYLIKLFYMIQTCTILGYEDKRFLEDAKRFAEEFLELIKGREEEFGFFYVYVFNYLFSVLRNLGDEVSYEKYLKKVLKEGLPVPDFYFYAFGFYRDKLEYDKAFEALKRLFLLLDEVEVNPFSYGISFASDRFIEFKRVLFEDLGIFEDRGEELLKLWKKQKGKYLGLLVIKLVPFPKKGSLMKKLLRKFGEDSFVLSVCLKELEDRKGEGILVDVLRIYPEGYLKDFVRAKLLEVQGKVGEAVDFYYKALSAVSDPFIALHALSLIEKDENLRDKVKSFPSSSDNS
jgi:glycosyltransferase involved in cell wall biosynthesis